MRNSKDTASGRQQTPARERREWVKPAFAMLDLSSAQTGDTGKPADGGASA